MRFPSSMKVCRVNRFSWYLIFERMGPIRYLISSLMLLLQQFSREI